MPSPSRSPRRLLAAVLTIVALTAAACGGSASGVLDLPADEVLATAVERSGEYDTARLRIRTVTSTPQGELTMVGEGAGGAAAAVFTATMQGPAFEGGVPVEMEVRLVDGTIYQRSEVFSEALGTDAEWISIDVDAAVPGLGAIIQQARQYDPTQSLSYLQDLARVSEVGPETVNGVSTKHYTAVMTMRAAFESAAVDDATMQQYVDLTGVDLDADVPMEVWIDDQGLVRRTRVQVTTDAFSTDTTTDILEYGVTVDVTSPPADETVSLEDLQG